MSSRQNTRRRVDQFFTGAEARFDRWRSLLQAARSWKDLPVSKVSIEKASGGVWASLSELRQWEDFLPIQGTSC